MALNSSGNSIMYLRTLFKQIKIHSRYPLVQKFSIYNENRPLTNVKACHTFTTLIKTRRTSNYSALTIYKRNFHLTNSNRALSPIAWMILRHTLKFVAVFTGRAIRIWWSRLPGREKERVLQEIENSRAKLMVTAAVLGGTVIIYYVGHLVEDPITGRKQFLLFTENQMKQQALFEVEILMRKFKTQIVTSGYQYNYVMRIVKQLVQSNMKLPGVDVNWNVLIVNDRKIKNALVLSSGHIFIFSGMLTTVKNEDQLASVIAHEMAHALLHHSSEAASNAHLVEMLMLVPIFVVWTLLPDAMALFSHFFTEFSCAVLFKLPLSRSLEKEADALGLEMVARACYDPRGAADFWKVMEESEGDIQIESFSTHPSFKTRRETLNRLMPKAFDIQNRHCHKSDMDPYSSRSRHKLYTS